MQEFFSNIGGADKDPGRMNALVLAYIGDTVYDLYVRTHLIARYDENAHSLHIRAIGMVNAKAQAGAVELIYDGLNEEERDIYRRGRNAKSSTVPKNADVAEYHRATGLEALIGYLYIKGDFDRINQLMEKIIPGLSGREGTKSGKDRT